MKPGRIIAFVTLAMTALPLGAQDSSDPFAAMRAREIGPAGMSGRVADVEVVLSDPNIIYVGSSTGGLFKSDDGGIAWNPVFDEQDVLGIGAIALFQPNPDIVWVGTGEGNPRNSADGPGHRVRRRHGTRVVGRSGTRAVPYARRRPHLGSRAVAERAYRHRGRGHGPVESGQAFCGDVGVPPYSLGPQVGWPWIGTLRDLQRGRCLDATFRGRRTARG